LSASFGALLRHSYERAPSPEVIAEVITRALAERRPRARYHVRADARLPIAMKRCSAMGCSTGSSTANSGPDEAGRPAAGRLRLGRPGTAATAALPVVVPHLAEPTPKLADLTLEDGEGRVVLLYAEAPLPVQFADRLNLAEGIGGGEIAAFLFVERRPGQAALRVYLRRDRDRQRLLAGDLAIENAVDDVDRDAPEVLLVPCGDSVRVRVDLPLPPATGSPPG